MKPVPWLFLAACSLAIASLVFRVPEEMLLSFDIEPVDGRESVIAVLDSLARHNASATFFVTGKYAELYPDMIKLMAISGHDVGCHSYSHPVMTRLSSEEKIEQIKKCTLIIENTTGICPIGFRAPYNRVDYETTQILAEFGYSYDASRFEGYQFGRLAIKEMKIDCLIFPFSDVISMHYLHVPKSLYYWLIAHAGNRVSASFHPHIWMESKDEFDNMLEDYKDRKVTYLRHSDVV
jgi:peptidoglycan/xylan/chitin deacetylase (PgdA/CDA1 family)